MKPPSFDYAVPEALDDAVNLLFGESSAKVLAGGQSLVPLLSLRLATPSLLVDLRRVPGLDDIECANGAVVIGSMVRQRRAEHNDGLRASVPLLAAALAHVAHPQIRSQGTIGGSIAHGDPAGELPAVLVALDGRVRARGPAGERIIAAEDFFTGFLTTSLSEDEILTAIEFDEAPPDTGVACVEVAQRSGDYALCGAVAQLRLEDGLVADARLALIGMGDRPVRARGLEAALTGERASAESVAAIVHHIAEDAKPIDDPQVPADYRLQLAQVVARRALVQAIENVAI